MILWQLLIVAASSFLTPRPTTQTGNTMLMGSDALQNLEFEDEIKPVLRSYISAKYRACDSDGTNCRAYCDTAEIAGMLEEILPPVTREEWLWVRHMHDLSGAPRATQTPRCAHQ